MDVKQLEELWTRALAAFPPSLEQYEKLAKELVKAWESGDADVLQSIKKRHPPLRQHSDSALRGTRFTLADAQFIIAREHHFESWPKFAKHIEALTRASSLVSQFESAVNAVITGDVATLGRLLRANPELIRARSTREHHATLLHYVGANGVEGYRQKTPKNAVEVAKILLNSGAEVNAVADMYDGLATLGLVATSVHPLLAGVQIALLETLLQNGAAIDEPGGSTVNGCLANGRGEAAEFLARRDARLDLEGAAGVGRLDVVKSFFNQDGSLKTNATKEQMMSGFAWACEFGRTNVVDFLLQNGIEVDARLRHHGQTGLHWAAYAGHSDTVKLLLEREAQADAKDESFAGTPLGWALYGWGEPAPEGRRDNYYEVVAVLVAAGATVDPEWLADPDREMLEEKVRADRRMVAALSGQMHR